MAPEGTAGTPDKSERIAEAISRLHPQLQEALKNAPAAAVYKVPREYDGEFLNQEWMLRSIDNINEVFAHLVTGLDNQENRYIWPRAGEALMDCIGVNSRLLWEGGMFVKVLTAVRAFAMTRLREELKKPSSVPFDPAEFERERIINRIIEDIFNPEKGSESSQGGGVG
jgi:hypothetical protein